MVTQSEAVFGQIVTLVTDLRTACIGVTTPRSALQDYGYVCQLTQSVVGEVERPQGGEVSNGSGEVGQLVGGEVQRPQRSFH